jgi:hypothetical protein
LGRSYSSATIILPTFEGDNPVPTVNQKASASRVAERARFSLTNGDGHHDEPDLASDPRLIERISEDIAAMGLVGEKDPGLLVYLVYSSRKRRRPLSVIIKGPSGSGKDQIQRRPADLMPPEDVIDLMTLSREGLYYGEPDWLKNKIILGGERKHRDDDIQHDNTSAIRQMLSHGYITKHTVVEFQGMDIRQDGPISYSETTTKDSIFNEDSNRCLQVGTNASQALSKKVVQASAAVYLPGPPSSNASLEAVKERHHALQRSLQSVDVRIPYAEILAKHIPKTKIEVRRIFNYVLSLIEVITYLHQHQRDRNAFGQLEATIEDYTLARRLILGPLHEAIGLGKEHAKGADKLQKLPDGDFTTTHAIKLLGASSALSSVS